MSRRFQFSLKWLFVAMLAVACFFGGIRFERERQRRQDLIAAEEAKAKERQAQLAYFKRKIAATAANGARVEPDRKAIKAAAEEALRKLEEGDSGLHGLDVERKVFTP